MLPVGLFFLLLFQNGDTPLKHAATNGHLLIAQILLEHGANTEEVDAVSVCIYIHTTVCMHLLITIMLSYVHV